MLELEEQEEAERQTRIAARPRAPARMINPDESKWRGLRESLLEREYGRSSAYLASFYITKTRRPHREVVYQRKYAKIIDKGPVITAAEGNRDEIRAMLELARLKNWTSVQFKGTVEFCTAAMRAALTEGFKVEVKTAEDAALLREIQRERTSSHSYGVLSPMPGPAPRPRGYKAP